MNRVSTPVKVCVAATAGALACMVFSLPAAADDSGLKFSGGIGVIPVSAVIGCPAVNPCPTGTGVSVNRNIIRGVQPPGQIWVINELQANVSANGSITVNGQGLVLAGGDNAGRAPALSVFASLFCGPAATATESDTTLTGVTLSPTGDFQINDMLAPVPATPCVNPMLLIRNAGTTGGNPWFAVGILGSGHHHDD
jgi:hypothetical protein